EESRLKVTFLAFLVIACLLAAVGVLTDSAVTIVGAMVVGPEFGPLAALAVAIVLRRWDIARRAALALGAGFPLAMVVTLGGPLPGVHRAALGQPSRNRCSGGNCVDDAPSWATYSGGGASALTRMTPVRPDASSCPDVSSHGCSVTSRVGANDSRHLLRRRCGS